MVLVKVDPLANITEPAVPVPKGAVEELLLLNVQVEPLLNVTAPASAATIVVVLDPVPNVKVPDILPVVPVRSESVVVEPVVDKLQPLGTEKSVPTPPLIVIVLDPVAFAITVAPFCSLICP